MAQRKEEQYKFTPVDNTLPSPDTGKGSIKIPGHIETRNLLMVVNATRGVIIASQFDPAKGWGRLHGHVYPGDPNYPDPDFPYALDGTCTYILDYDTSGMSSNDQLSIYIDDYTGGEKFRPWDFGTDAIERMRVSNPQSLIDADFEYGIQQTKWQNHGSNRRHPSFYEIPGPPIVITGISSDGTATSSSYSLITVTVSANGLSAGTPVSVTGTTNGLADGLFIIESDNSPTNTTFSYRAKGVITSGSIETAYTVVKKGGIYTGADLGLSSITLNSPSNGFMTLTFSDAHGLVPGSPLTLYDTTAGRQVWEGNFFANTISSPTTVVVDVSAPTALTGTPTVGNISTYARNDSFFTHRPFDGGVYMGPLLPIHGLEAKRQTKQYFRYQSGKGFLFSTGALLNPTFDVESVTFSGTTITITTEFAHGLQVGAKIFLEGLSSAGYYGAYTVDTITSDKVFTVETTATGLDATAVLGEQPRITVTNWNGAVIRTGMFDDQNGLYYEYDGQQLYACKRSSTFQLAGTVTINNGSRTVTGTNTRFLSSQLKVNDLVVIRGQSYRITSINSNTSLTVSPENRGTTATNVKMTKTVDERVPQKNFNYDTINGHGPSGYAIRLSRMQMWGIQFSWYGAGFADFMIRGPLGSFIKAHRFANHNVNYEAYLRSANLPARYEVDNCAAYARVLAATGTGTSDIQLDAYGRFPEPTPGYPAYVLLSGQISGTTHHEIVSYTGKSSVNITTQGTNYVVGEQVEAADSNGFVIEVTGITDTGGIARFKLITGGTGYSAGNVTMNQAAATGTAAVINVSVTGGVVTSGPGNPTLTGITRATSYNLFLAGSSRTFQAETSAQSFGANDTTAMLLNTNFSPTISHWGSSVIMDGGFDKDLGFIFSTSVTGVSVGGSSSSTVLLFRPSPAVSDTIPGDFGDREVINRSQVTLKNIEVNNISGREYQITAILNPSNIGAANWTNANTQTVGTTSLFQPSFSQIATSGGTILGGTAPVDGEILFQFIGTAAGSETFSLGGLKEVQNSIISGPGTFPDGPEVIAFYISNNNNQAGNFDIVLQWTEAQA